MIALDDLHRSRACLFDPLALIAAVTADFFGEVKAVGDFVENQRYSVAILNACRVNLGFEKHSERVDQDVPLAALDNNLKAEGPQWGRFIEKLLLRRNAI